LVLVIRSILVILNWIKKLWYLLIILWSVTEPWSWEKWLTLYTFGACNKVALKILLLCLHILYYISQKRFCSDATYPFQLSKFTIGKLLQKYFCKKIHVIRIFTLHWLVRVINSKFKLKTVNSILHYLCYYLPTSKYYTKEVLKYF